MSTPISTTTAGSLPRTDRLIRANDARPLSEDGFTLGTTPEFEALLTDEVEGLLRRQQDIGLTVPGDGEYGKAMTRSTDYGAWWSYSFQRVGGLALAEEGLFDATRVRSEPGRIRLTSFPDRRDWVRFRAAYQDPSSGIAMGENATAFPATVAPLTYQGKEQIDRDIANLKAALAATGQESGFITALSPGSGARIPNQHYATDEEHVWAWAEVLREEYKAVLEAGLILQIDDPSIAEAWDQINPEPTVEDYLAYTQIRIDALNHAIRGLDTSRIRFHLCWGSWHGPHTTDLELKHLLKPLLSINAGQYSFEAANVRHEHEWSLWADAGLPEDKVLLPGIVSHSTNVVEHPDLVAERIGRFVRAVGPERVIASTDCGLGGRIHPDIAWAKLESLTEGARRAGDRLGVSAAAAV